MLWRKVHQTADGFTGNSCVFLRSTSSYSCQQLLAHVSAMCRCQRGHNLLLNPGPLSNSFPPRLHAALNPSRTVIHKCSFCRSLDFLQGRGSELMSFCSFFRMFRDKYCKYWEFKDSMTAALVGNGILFPQKAATFQFVFPCWNLKLPWSQTKSHKQPNLTKHPFSIKSFSYIDVLLLQTSPTPPLGVDTSVVSCLQHSKTNRRGS